MIHRQAAIVAVGDELVLGQRLDTNSQWLAAQLTDAGVEVCSHCTVGDDLEAIVRAIRQGTHHASLVVVTGGLGPTQDDLTRQALAQVSGRALREDAQLLAAIKARFAAHQMDMAPNNRVQALVPEGGSGLPNAHGTAPGLHVVLDKAQSDQGHAHKAEVFCLPGPPAEMKPMFHACVKPRLVGGRIVRTRVMGTVGVGESTLAHTLGELMNRSHEAEHVMVGTTASLGVVNIRLRASVELAADHPRTTTNQQQLIEQLEARLDDIEASIRAVLGPAVYTKPGEQQEIALADVLLGMLKANEQTLAVVESCTGGLLGSMLTAVPGSSAVFAGGWITYTNAMKAHQVGVPEVFFPEVAAGAPGAVSSEVAQAMALGAKARAQMTWASDRNHGNKGGNVGVDWALSITGIAGPDGGSPDKPVGTVWICCAGPYGWLDTRRFVFPNQGHSTQGDGRVDQQRRAAVRQWAAISALAMLLEGLRAGGGGRGAGTMQLAFEQERRAV